MLTPDSIHNAVLKAQETPDSSQERLTEVGTTKLTSTTKDKADAILARNGVTMSGFLRHCVTVLCEQYDPAHKE